jgi:hypothetical protein
MRTIKGLPLPGWTRPGCTARMRLTIQGISFIFKKYFGYIKDGLIRYALKKSKKTGISTHRCQQIGQ